jgi:FMN-dependent oxidoreductase (nitrilotriacetate monooxygenase family)
MTQTRPIHLVCFFGGVGQHQAAWRLPDSRAEEAESGLALHADLAALAEHGRFDALFIADGLYLDVARTEREPMGLFEPITTLSAMAARTNHIGLIGSVSTTFSAPYNTARQLMGLDLLSGGRAGWNIVTSAAGEENFGDAPLPPHQERYRRAGEFVDSVLALWESWDDDAIVLDRAAGRYADPSRIHRVDFRGEHFAVAGPLNLPRSPQGHPILAQAGSSDDGRRFAAEQAELVFTAQQTLEDAVAFRSDIRARAVAAGRDPDGLRVLPGVCPFIGDTEEAAWERVAELGSLADVEMGREQLQQQLAGADIGNLLPEEPIPPERLPDESTVQGRRSRYALFRRLAVEERWTLRQLIDLEVAATGHWLLVGSPQQVAEALIERVEAGGADGFVVMPPYLPEGLERFVDAVVPILQDRGAVRREYAETTLRGHLGLPRPAATGGITGSVR